MLVAAGPVPEIYWIWPFVALLLAIAILPLVGATHHWWEQNRNKLMVSAVLAAITLGYYALRDYGVPIHSTAPAAPAAGHASDAPSPPAAAAAHASDVGHAEDAHPRTAPGIATVKGVLKHAVLLEYVPFMTLLFALYVVAGGIMVRGDIRATPTVNTTILAIGGLLASFIGTTGASMVLIRLLLRTNSERRRVTHTVVFFIFVVSNVGGTLLPIGDPPLFLGYLKGVPFFWTLTLWREWAVMMAALLVVYFIWDTWAYRHETPADIKHDVEQREALTIVGLGNCVWLAGILFAVITLSPDKPFPGTNWHPWPYLREAVQLAMAGMSLLTTRAMLRAENQFNYGAINEVACLFIGIFITMQVPLEILNARGTELGIDQPWEFFWATGLLSAFLDNAPTYVVFFQVASVLPMHADHELALLGGQHINELLLQAISCGAVFMGAMTYIGNGPNFMVRTIAERAGVKMPSFFGFMAYSVAVLVPLFVGLTFLFFR